MFKALYFYNLNNFYRSYDLSDFEWLKIFKELIASIWDICLKYAV